MVAFPSWQGDKKEVGKDIEMPPSEAFLPYVFLKPLVPPTVSLLSLTSGRQMNALLAKLADKYYQTAANSCLDLLSCLCEGGPMC